MSILDDIAVAPMPSQVGPGVYDIHAPLTPSVDEIVAYLEAAIERIPRRAAVGIPTAGQRRGRGPRCDRRPRTWWSRHPMVVAASIVRERIEARSPVGMAG
jgi:Cobalamin-independent synthase, Catalytic domain